MGQLQRRNGTPLQCSCLENPRGGGDWWAAIYGVAQSWTRLKRQQQQQQRKKRKWRKTVAVQEGEVDNSIKQKEAVFLLVSQRTNWRSVVGTGKHDFQILRLLNKSREQWDGYHRNEISESKDPTKFPRTKSKMMKQLKLMCKQGGQLGALWWSTEVGDEKRGPRGRGYIYTQSWLTMLYSRS